ncbi:hypothetical protein B1J94_15365 [Leptospira kirschneri serovar Grippotyphosa]|nr:hypothetical protein B1J94_15365 [Leptospira kirschneri serovar Grippotyphosa]
MCFSSFIDPFRVISNSYDFKSYSSEQNFAVVPTFKESIYKVQIQLFSELWFSYALLTLF